jgi:hypothetical protein
MSSGMLRAVLTCHLIPHGHMAEVLMMISIAIPTNYLLDRLRKHESDLSEENNHDAAFLISITIEAIKSLISKQEQPS